MSEEKKDDVAQDPQQATANSNIDGTKAADAAADRVTDRTSLPPRSSARR